MQKIVPLKCPKCNNKDSFYRYGKDKDSYQKYLCRKCNHQFAPDRPVSKKVPKYPRYPVCGKATFLHHDYEYYSNYRCCDKNRYSAYKVPVKSVLGSSVKHIRVESFKDDISNNLIESFHHQFKAWYKTKYANLHTLSTC
jgi:hypothetical protein